MQKAPVRVVLRRGDLPESVHLVRVAFWRGGRLEASAGDTDAPVFLRSSAKLFQALACVTTGAADRFSMTAAELAIACGSHNGEPFHTETSGGLIARIGKAPPDLLCGAHVPMHDPSAKALHVRGEEPTVLHNNCSGKHAAMLAACVAAGWPTEDYVRFDHPLQVLNRAHVAAFCGVSPEDVHLAVDGCSAPNFAVSLAASARGVAAWCSPGSATHVGDAARLAAARIADALAERPEMIGGTRRIDTDLIRITKGRLLSKMGAEGVWIVGVRDGETGLAIKCEDGSGRAPYPVGLAVLRHRGLLSEAEWDALGHWHDPALRNHRKIVVGRTDVEPPEGV
jgi:L-asparaginase II